MKLFCSGYNDGLVLLSCIGALDEIFESLMYATTRLLCPYNSA